jgi:cytosine deaminase
MLDLIVRNAHLAGSADGALVDIGVEAGRIVVLAPVAGERLTNAAEAIDAGGALVSAGLVETHIHLDKSHILDRCTPSPNRGTDHMKRVAAVKPGFTVDDVHARAARSLESCVLHGAMHMRTHVEVDPNVGLRGFEGVKRLVDEYAWAIDVELCAFIQEGWTGVPEADANMVAAIEGGATVVGGAPGYDPDHEWQIRRIFELATRYDLDVDIHLDMGFTTHDMDIWLVCELADRYGWGGRTAIGHGTKYSCLTPDELDRLGSRLADSGVAVTVLPATDLFVTGRHQDHAVLRGVADANVLHRCGVTCSLSTNNILNPFTPFGDGSLTRIANLYANTVQRGMASELADCFAMLSRQSAKLLRRGDYGIAVGNPADLVVWDAADAGHAVATAALPLHGFKRGPRRDLVTCSLQAARGAG